MDASLCWQRFDGDVAAARKIPGEEHRFLCHHATPRRVVPRRSPSKQSNIVLVCPTSQDRDGRRSSAECQRSGGSRRIAQYTVGACRKGGGPSAVTVVV